MLVINLGQQKFKYGDKWKVVIRDQLTGRSFMHSMICNHRKSKQPGKHLEHTIMENKETDKNSENKQFGNTAYIISCSHISLLVKLVAYFLQDGAIQPSFFFFFLAIQDILGNTQQLFFFWLFWIFLATDMFSGLQLLSEQVDDGNTIVMFHKRRSAFHIALPITCEYREAKMSPLSYIAIIFQCT